MSKNSTITINGRHYDAETGEPLSPAAARAAGHHAAPTPVHRIHSVHHERTKAHPAHPAHAANPARQATRRRIGHVAAHHPKPSQTLMRQAVKKPGSDLRRRIKVNGQLDSSAKRTSSKMLVKSGARQPSVHHIQHHATKRPKGKLISHFSPDLFSVEGYTPAVTYGTAPVRLATANHAAPAAHGRQTEVRKPQTTAELLEYAVQHASNPDHPLPHRQRRLFRRRAHA